MRRLLLLVALSGLTVLIVATIVTAVTAANTVPPTRAGETREGVDPGLLAPSECDSISLTNKLSGSGVVAGTLGNDWIVASDSADTITGLAGDDCIEARGEADVIDGGPGTDVCLSGAAVDTFIGCETEIQ